MLTPTPQKTNKKQTQLLANKGAIKKVQDWLKAFPSKKVDDKSFQRACLIRLSLHPSHTHTHAHTHTRTRTRSLRHVALPSRHRPTHTYTHTRTRSLSLSARTARGSLLTPFVLCSGVPGIGEWRAAHALCWTLFCASPYHIALIVPALAHEITQTRNTHTHAHCCVCLRLDWRGLIAKCRACGGTHNYTHTHTLTHSHTHTRTRTRTRTLHIPALPQASPRQLRC